ncbi:MAG: HDOD domain-containing protein [bacterium]|nr:HDOD domain-containing protein [bacterium]
MSLRDEILDKVHSLPPMPSTAMGLMKLLKDPEADIAEIRRLMEHDQGLTTNTLRLANSAYVGGGGAIATLQDAIVRLGTRRVFELALGSAVAPVAQRPIRGYDLPAGGLLRHSVSTAIAAEQLADTLGMAAPDQTFTAGLLHDLGKIVLGTFLEVDAGPIMEMAFEQRVSFQEAERRVLGLDHAEAGAVLLEGWEIPRVLVDAVRWHHEPDEYTGDDSLLVGLVHVGDELGRMSGTGDGADGLNYAPSENVLQRLNVTNRVAEVVVSRVLTSLAELGGMLSQNSGVDGYGA